MRLGRSNLRFDTSQRARRAFAFDNTVAAFMRSSAGAPTRSPMAHRTVRGSTDSGGTDIARRDDANPNEVSKFGKRLTRTLDHVLRVVDDSRNVFDDNEFRFENLGRSHDSEVELIFRIVSPRMIV